MLSGVAVPLTGTLLAAVGTYGDLGDLFKNYAKNIVGTNFLPMFPTQAQFNARINQELARGTQVASMLPSQAQFNTKVREELAKGEPFVPNQEEINAKIDEALANGTPTLPNQEQINARIDQELAKPISQGTDPLGV